VTQGEINQMVEQAGFHGMLSIGVVMDSKQLEAFAKLVAAKAIAELESQEPWCMKMNGCKTKCEDCPEKAPRRTEQNFCPRCGKRTKDLTNIHTCTPPQD
jgi:Zn finger protein HypA/HybF involved in hydrogenase expression